GGVWRPARTDACSSSLGHRPGGFPLFIGYDPDPKTFEPPSSFEFFLDQSSPRLFNPFERGTLEV
ncbi:MAG: hypothetical protein ABJH20_07900, partial [Rhizobiaceae bacterium]